MKNFGIILLFFVLTCQVYGNKSSLDHTLLKGEEPATHLFLIDDTSPGVILWDQSIYFCQMTATVAVNVPPFGAFEVTITVQAETCAEAAAELKKGVRALIFR